MVNEEHSILTMIKNTAALSYSHTLLAILSGGYRWGCYPISR